MPRDAESLKIQKWADTGDRTDPDASSLTPPLVRVTGWPASFSRVGGNAPRRRVFNQLFRELSGMAVELNEHGGLLEWDTNVSYIHPAFVCGSDNDLYASVQDSTGIDPTTDSDDSHWYPAFHARIPFTRFTSSGTWTKPRGVSMVYVEVIGGGRGGGANIDATQNAGGDAGIDSGGGGEYNRQMFDAAIVNDTESVLVGAASTGGVASAGNGWETASTPRTSSFGTQNETLIYAYGGTQFLTDAEFRAEARGIALRRRGRYGDGGFIRTASSGYAGLGTRSAEGGALGNSSTINGGNGEDSSWGHGAATTAAVSP